jgi:hypothetical protein
LRTDILKNDVIKLADKRLVFISTNNDNELFILVIDFYNDNYNAEMRRYKFSVSPYKFTKELSAHVYNDYLAISATLENPGFFSIFFIFGFGNGTDFTIDISPYLVDTDKYDVGNNLVTRLLQDLRIENNLFRYIPVNKIILVSYPPELKIFRNGDYSELLPNSPTEVDNIELFQNFELNKTSELYKIEYQYMVKEPDYSTFVSYTREIYKKKKTGDNSEYSSYYTPKTFYGRTNILSFKLCHNYCQKCNIFGTSDNYQRCFVCLPDYTYDYMIKFHTFTENCVPKDQMYDYENGKLIFCNSTLYKFYHNITRNNETYC